MNLPAEIMRGFAMRAALALAKDVLDESDKVALCVAAGLPVAMRTEGTTVIFTTPTVGFYRDQNQRWVVAVREDLQGKAEVQE